MFKGLQNEEPWIRMLIIIIESKKIPEKFKVEEIKRILKKYQNYAENSGKIKSDAFNEVLNYAIKNNRYEAAEFCRKYAADPTVRVDDKTPLMQAIDSGSSPENGETSTYRPRTKSDIITRNRVGSVVDAPDTSPIAYSEELLNPIPSQNVKKAMMQANLTLYNIQSNGNIELKASGYYKSGLYIPRGCRHEI